MILAAAVCPHPPVLVPEVAPGTFDELAALRAACDAAVGTLIGVQPERIVVIGGGRPRADVDESAGGTMAAYGVNVSAGGTSRDLPLSLAVGAWLLDRADWTGPRTYSTGRPALAGNTAVLVMADGTATRSVQAPGFFDERAEPFDAQIAAALANGDAAALAGLDVELGSALGAAGVPALRTLGEIAKGAVVTAQMRYNEAPFGVGYFVADWEF